jgi:hypothetical protein
MSLAIYNEYLVKYTNRTAAAQWLNYFEKNYLKSKKY